MGKGRQEEKVRVLVVDDDKRMVKTISDILKVKGYETAGAYAGEEALEKVKSVLPDCVLMDIKMPGVNGLDVLKKIKDVFPELPVLLMSAYTTEEQVVEARRAGAEAVLTKPIDIQGLLSFLALLRKGESILVVDDDPDFAGMLKDLLEVRGYSVETEGDPDKVLAHIEQNGKLLIILDLKLGDIDGLDVLKGIRAKYPSKPVILVTGYGAEMKASIEMAYKIGAYTCLYKPFESGALIRQIEEISRKKRLAFLETTA